MILVLDDLHWADAATLQLLRHVVRATEREPLLVLGTYRTLRWNEAHPLALALAELRSARALETLTLTGLGEEDLAALIWSRSERAASGDLRAIDRQTVPKAIPSSSRSCCER